MAHTLACPYLRKSFGWCVPIGGLAGLIGLGGGEFRLPLLMHGIGFEARSAVPLNLLVSFVTLAFALTFRNHAVALPALGIHLPEISGLALGGIASAVYGARLVGALSAARLTNIIALLLAAIGALMFLEAIRPFQMVEWLPPFASVHFALGAFLGLGIGLISSLLGVAGGEFIIPALVFLFGFDIRTAGTASILISLLVVLTGLWRYWRMNAIPRGRGVKRILSAMGAGSVIGAALGGLAVGYAPVGVLKAALGVVLIAAAAKTLTGHRKDGRLS